MHTASQAAPAATNGSSPRTERRATHSPTREHRPHQVLLIEIRTIAFITGHGTAEKNVAIRLAIETIQDRGPMLAVTINEGEQHLMVLAFNEPANILHAYRLFRTLCGMKKIATTDLQPLISMVNNEQLPKGKQFKKFRQRARSGWDASKNLVPESGLVLQTLLQCREFKIEPNTRSLTKLAAKGKFTITPELEKQGMMTATAYVERQKKIDKRIEKMRPDIKAICDACGMKIGDVVPSVSELIECGLNDRAILAYVGYEYFEHELPPFGLMMGPYVLIARVNPVQQAIELVTLTLEWPSYKAMRAERELIGLLAQLRAGSLKHVETSEL